MYIYERKKADAVAYPNLLLFCLILSLHQLLCSVDLAGTKATRTNCNGLGCTVNDRSYLTDIGLPCSVGLTMRVRDRLSEDNALSANAALCHIDTSSNALYTHMFQFKFNIKFIERYLLYHNNSKIAIAF